MGLLPGNIVKPERLGGGFQGLVNDVLCEDRMTFFCVNPAATVREHGQNRFVVNLDSERAEYVSCFRNNLLDKFVSQESDCWSHGNVLSISCCLSWAMIPLYLGYRLTLSQSRIIPFGAQLALDFLYIVLFIDVMAILQTKN